jgi:peptidoglycan/xylan/chitin deacetylase (PgdA/CDA1 family)
MTTTSRRKFLKGMGVAGAALGAAGLTPPRAAYAQREGSRSGGVSRPLEFSAISEGHFKVRHKPIKWPNNARIAVTWVVNYESLTDAATSNQQALVDYSNKAGFRRLLDMFERNGVKGTWYTNCLIATRYPEHLKELVRLGHEVDGHNFANNISMPGLTPAEEKELIDKCFNDVEKLTGYHLPGWMGSGEAESATTMEYLVDNGQIWNGDFSTDDVPYTIKVNGKKVVIVPYQRESNDTQITSHRYHPSVWLNKFKDQFDVMYEEGATYPTYLSAATHAWILGHPAGSKAVEEAIQYAAGFPDVWNTTEADVAKYWLKMNYD